MKKFAVYSIIGISAAALAAFGWYRGVALNEWQTVAHAAGTMPWQDGGTITMVRECVLDTPPPPTGPFECGISCPFVTSVYHTACPGYIQLDVQAQRGTQFIAVPRGFTYQGGGAYPRSGQQFLVGGASPALPWVIGIPQ